MSVVKCDGGCTNHIDTDFDVESVVPDPRYSLKPFPDLHYCPKCRDRLEAEQDEANNHPTDEELEALGCGGLK